MGIDPQRITMINNRLSFLRTRVTESETTRDRLNGEIERLEEAKGSIAEERSTHGDFRLEVLRSIRPIDHSRFQGNNRNRTVGRTNSLHNHLFSQSSHHRENYEELGRQISTREEERDTAVTRIANDNREITSLESELRAMMTL